MEIRLLPRAFLRTTSCRKRIAHGSGTSIQEVNQLLKQYVMMRKQMKRLGKNMGMQRKLMGMKLPGM